MSPLGEWGFLSLKDFFPGSSITYTYQWVYRTQLRYMWSVCPVPSDNQTYTLWNSFFIHMPLSGLHILLNKQWQETNSVNLEFDCFSLILIKYSYILQWSLGGKIPRFRPFFLFESTTKIMRIVHNDRPSLHVHCFGTSGWQGQNGGLCAKEDTVQTDDCSYVSNQ